jgi:hypothetical protein
MSNGKKSVYERLFKLQAAVGKLILDKKRDPDEIAKIYQAILDDDEIKIRLKRMLMPFFGFKVPASTEKFIAIEHFYHCKDQCEPRFSFGDQFMQEDYFSYHFLEQGGKTEPPQGQTIVEVYRVQQTWSDKEIIAELGGESKVEITLRELYFIVQQQPDGRPGILLTPKGVNVFFIRDWAKRLHTVIFHWDGQAWQVDSPSGINTISEGSQVFVRGCLQVL